jgi:protein-tyrosine kinase
MNDISSPLASDSTSGPVGDHRSIARRDETKALTPVQLDDRAIIHYTEESRAQVDAFRELRTRLLATSYDNFVTLVVPVSRGCGGSFVARNLAVAFTFDQFKNALLIDCNLRNPTQHASMRIDPTSGGLINYLENADEDIATVLYETGVPRLRLLPAGTSRHGNGLAEYFSSFRMRFLLDSLRRRYPDRYIFLDGPPVLGAPDARILAELADVVILVTGYGRDNPQDIARAAANFDPNKFAGVVFNEGV